MAVHAQNPKGAATAPPSRGMSPHLEFWLAPVSPCCWNTGKPQGCSSLDPQGLTTAKGSRNPCGESPLSPGGRGGRWEGLAGLCRGSVTEEELWVGEAMARKRLTPASLLGGIRFGSHRLAGLRASRKDLGVERSVPWSFWDQGVRRTGLGSVRVHGDPPTLPP